MGKPLYGHGWMAGGVGARRFVRMLPALLIAGGLVFDIASPPRFTAVPLFVAAP